MIFQNSFANIFWSAWAWLSNKVFWLGLSWFFLARSIPNSCVKYYLFLKIRYYIYLVYLVHRYFRNHRKRFSVAYTYKTLQPYEKRDTNFRKFSRSQCFQFRATNVLMKRKILLNMFRVYKVYLRQIFTEKTPRVTTFFW